MSFVSGLLLSTLLASAAAQTPPARGGATGTASLGDFHDARLKLDFSYPPDYLDATALVKPAMQASVGQAFADAAQCISLEMARMAPAGGELRLILLVRADAGCLKRKFDAKSVSEFTEGEAKGMLAAGAHADLGKPTDYQLAGRPASSVSGSLNLPTGQALQARAVCVLVEPDVACWQFLAPSKAAIDLLSGLPVTFAGSEAVAMWPPAPEKK